MRGKETLQRFLVRWSRVGAEDTFDQVMLASSAERAKEASVAEIELALGPNAELWEIQSIVDLGPAYGFVAISYPR